MAVPIEAPHVASGCLLLCRAVEQRENGLNLLGVHDTRVVSEFPCKFDDLKAYFRLETLSPGKVPLEFELQPPGDTEPTRVMNVVRDVQDLHDELIIPLDRLEFHQDGIHVFTFFTSKDRIVATTSMCIILEGAPETRINSPAGQDSPS